MPTLNSFSDSFSDFIHQRASAACQQASRLQAEVDEANRVCQFWDALEAYVSKGWSRHVMELLKGDKPLMESIRAGDAASLAHLDELYQAASKQAEEVQRRFPAHLDESCARHNLPLDRSSRHPRYTFADGFFQVDIDDRRGTARLSDYEGRLDEFPADVGAVVEAVEREHDRIFDRPFDPDKFLKKLRHQYAAVAKAENQSDGASIPIRSITQRLGKNEKGFRTDEFLVDLSRLVASGSLEAEGYRLDLQHTKDTGQGMLLYGAAGRGYVGFVVFRKV